MTYENVHERAHLDILGAKAVTFRNATELLGILVDFPSAAASVKMRVAAADVILKTSSSIVGAEVSSTDTDFWDVYHQFNPEVVMQRFNELFLLETSEVEVSLPMAPVGLGNNELLTSLAAKEDTKEKLESVGYSLFVLRHSV